MRPAAGGHHDDWRQGCGLRCCQGNGPRRHPVAAEDEDGLGDPQEQPEARAELNEFHAYYGEAGRRHPALQRQYMNSIKALKNSTASEDHKRYRR